MSKFADRVSAARADAKNPAPFVRTLPPGAFSDAWKSRPRGPVQVGLRLLSIDETGRVAALAEANATKLYPETDSDEQRGLWIKAYNAELIHEALALAMCKSFDATAFYFDRAPQALIRVALTPGTAKALWEDYVALGRKLSPLSTEASDVDLGELADRVESIAQIEDEAVQARVRRNARALLDEIRAQLGAE